MNNIFETAGEFKSFGNVTTYDGEKFETYKFDNIDQYNLYYKAKFAYLDSYYYDVYTFLKLLFFLLILVIGFLINYYYFNNTSKVFLYLGIVWVFWVIYYIYKRNKLNNISINLNNKVNNKISQTQNIIN